MKPADPGPQDEFNRVVTQMTSSGVQPRTERTAPGPLRQVLQRVAAALRFDSGRSHAAARGLRGGPDEVRQLLFSAKGRDIDLRVAPAGDRYQLSGQVLGPDEGGQVALDAVLRAGSPPPPPTRHALIDPLGEFHLEAVDIGTYVLTLHLGADDIVLPPIDVCEPR